MADEVTAADIARLAGVGRAAVSNWRRRHDDFPRPVGGPATSPTFALPEVERWLEANGKMIDAPTLPRRSTPERIDGLDVLARVAASLLPPKLPSVVLDPGCRSGAMLVATASRYGTSVAYVGQDTDEQSLEAAQMALAEVGIERADLRLGSPLLNDALARFRGSADAVVCYPPAKSVPLSDEATFELPWEFGPPSQLDPYLAWLQVCYSYLGPGGTAAVTLPSSVAIRASGRRIRSEILRAGALRDVVALPSRFGPPASVPWQIWILTRPAERPTYSVRMVDVTDAAVPMAAAEWQATYQDPTRTRDVPSIELLDEDVMLVPARYIDAPVRDVSPEYERLREELRGVDLDLDLPTFGRGTGAASHAMTSVMDLVRLGAISVVDKASRPLAGDVLIPAGPDRFDASVLRDPVPDRAAGELLRCDSDVVDPHFLACFLRSEINRRQASGTFGGTPRLDVRRARIPRMPLSEQRQYGQAFRHLTGVTDRIADAAALADEAMQTAVYGLTSGVMAPEWKATPETRTRRTKR